MLNLYVVGDNYLHTNNLFNIACRDISGYLLEKSTIRHLCNSIKIDHVVSIDFVSSSDLHKFLPGRRDYFEVSANDIKDIIDFLDYVVRFRKWFDEVPYLLIGPINNFEAEISYSQCEVFVWLYSIDSGIEIKSPEFDFNSLTYQHLRDIEELTRKHRDSILNDIIHDSYAELIIEAEIKKWLAIKNNKLKEGELDMSEAITIDRRTIERINAMYGSPTSFYGFGATSPIHLRIEDVKFNGPATIVFWNDGTKTIVKCGEDDVLDREKGLAMAICKKVMGNKGNYYNEFKKWLEE